jgi:hypothetical protein
MDNRTFERQVGALRTVVTSAVGFHCLCEDADNTDGVHVRLLLYRANVVAAGLDAAHGFMRLFPLLLDSYPDRARAVDVVYEKAEAVAATCARLEESGDGDRDAALGEAGRIDDEAGLYDRCSDLALTIIGLFKGLGIAT